MRRDSDGTLGAYIRRQRELHEMSMRQVADLAGISNPYLSQIERGLREPSEKVLDAIARPLELSAEKLHDKSRRPQPDEEGADAAPSEVVEAIERDTRLTTAQRRALLEVYASFVVGRRPATSPSAA